MGCPCRGGATLQERLGNPQDIPFAVVMVRASSVTVGHVPEQFHQYAPSFFDVEELILVYSKATPN